MHTIEDPAKPVDAADLLSRFPPAAKARLAELRTAAETAGVQFSPREENALVAMRISAAAIAKGVTL